jgi:cytochrome c-type biogenesis protein CcmF
LGVAQRLLGALAITVIGIAATFAIEGGRPVLAPFAVGLALWVMAGACTDIVERTGLPRVSFDTALKRAMGLPRSTWGTVFAHFGVGLTLLGIVGETGWSAEKIRTLKPGETVSIRRYDFTFDGLVPREGPNYRELTAKFSVRRNGELIGVLEPGKRVFATRSMTTTEAALMTRGLSQLYLSLGDQNPDGSIAIRLYHKPLVLLIWLGTIVMVIGGTLSLTDRRLRVGAPKPARAKPAMQPAE